MPEYFYTWSKQTEVVPFDIQEAAEDYFVLSDGKRVYDFISTSFQASFGHSSRPIIERVLAQIQKLAIAPPKASFALKLEVTKRLIELLGLEEGKIFYTVSGSEAVENAIKMARRITGRPVILSRQRSYHGASLGAMSVSGDWRSSEHLNFTEGTRRIPEPDLDPNADEVRKIVQTVGPGRIAAIITETVSGTNGVLIPPVTWFAGLREVCDEFGIFLILDEVLVGFHRCGRPFAFHNFDVLPDMVCMSKAITGGYVPMGAVWTNDRIASFYDKNVLVGGLTNYAHPVGLAAIQGVLDLLREEKFLESLRQRESLFLQATRELFERHGGSELRTLGMLSAIEFGPRQLPNASDFLASGLHLFTKGNMMILGPPLTTDPDRMSAAFEMISRILEGGD